MDGDDPQEGPGQTHGTRVSGVIAAKTFNTTGLAGIAGGWQGQKGIRLIALRIVEPTFNNWDAVSAKEALDYLTSKRQQGNIVIANMSLQTDKTDDQLTPFMQSVQTAKNAGVIMVAAAGNLQEKPPYNQPNVTELPAPARWTGVLAIGASTYGASLQQETRSSYSLYDANGKLLMVAPVDKSPSLNIVTTYPGNQYYDVFNGTSAACPVAVGTIALMLSINSSIGYSTISDILAASAEKIGTYSYVNGRASEVGYGRINAQQALIETVLRFGGQVNTNLTVPSGKTWTFSPGITWTFTGNYKLRIEGNLVANGTPSNPITFTSSGGQWYGIEFYNGGSGSSIQYATIRNAQYGVYLYNTNVPVSNSTIQNNTTGIYMSGTSSTLNWNRV